MKVKEAVIISQIEAEEQAHARAVAARKVLPSGDTHTQYQQKYFKQGCSMLSAWLLLVVTFQDKHLHGSKCLPEGAVHDARLIAKAALAILHMHRQDCCTLNAIALYLSEQQLMPQAVQQVEARFAKEKGAEAGEKRIDRCKLLALGV